MMGILVLVMPDALPKRERDFGVTPYIFPAFLWGGFCLKWQHVTKQNAKHHQKKKREILEKKKLNQHFLLKSIQNIPSQS